MAVSPDALLLSPKYLAEIIRLVDTSTINISTGKALLLRVQESGRAPGEIVQAEGLAQVSDDSAIRAVAAALIEANPKEVQSYRAGKISLIGWFVGQVMRQMKGKADPNLTRQVLEDLLGQ
jgi:aspartyl-tRNA(Asn)/glutamyl-tRNA(Gln) amidotransferase subunit B